MGNKLGWAEPHLNFPIKLLGSLPVRSSPFEVVFLWSSIPVVFFYWGRILWGCIPLKPSFWWACLFWRFGFKNYIYNFLMIVSLKMSVPHIMLIPKKCRVPNKCWVPKWMLGNKNVESWKKFQIQRNFGPKIVLNMENNVGPWKMLVPNKMGFPNFVCTKKNVWSH